MPSRRESLSTARAAVRAGVRRLRPAAAACLAVLAAGCTGLVPGLPV